ncbi:hypothetical protein ACWD4Z_09490 [Streptomyces antibioticus]|uniref:hypothetical protein n=1 Tax=Streptomyces antibioticus TaxID=1890 RepID=UPI00224F9B02|nr:hypothetical protein [Streptomyces antibioticus]MCX5172578.1 hypothetical protein [Streptomyces antibioticus]
MSHQSRVDLAELRFGDDRLPGGGQAAELRTCEVPGLGRQLFKRYLPQTRDDLDAGALADLVAWRHELPGTERELLDRRCAWPRAVVTDADGVCGVLMAPAPQAFMQTVRRKNQVMTLPRALDNLARTRTSAGRLDMPYYEPPVKLAVLGRLVETAQWLHGHGWAVGDLQPRNALFTLDGGARVHLIDCDSCARLHGKSPFPPGDPEGWKLPEAGRFDEHSDYYKIAWSVVRCVQDNLESTRIDRAALLGCVTTPTLELLTDACQALPLPDARERWASLATGWPRLVTDRGMYVTVDGSLRKRWTPPAVQTPAPQPTRAPQPDSVPPPIPVPPPLAEPPSEPARPPTTDWIDRLLTVFGMGAVMVLLGLAFYGVILLVDWSLDRLSELI